MCNSITSLKVATVLLLLPRVSNNTTQRFGMYVLHCVQQSMRKQVENVFGMKRAPIVVNVTWP